MSERKEFLKKIQGVLKEFWESKSLGGAARHGCQLPTDASNKRNPSPAHNVMSIEQAAEKILKVFETRKEANTLYKELETARKTGYYPRKEKT